MSIINEVLPTPTNTPTKEKSDNKHRDRLLRALFKDPERARELCIAVSGTDYPEEAKVELYDLGTSLVKRFNDLSIVIDGMLLFMIEHQSSLSPNIPLRLLGHIVDILFSWFVETDKLYRNKLYKIPEPKFYVLYNGEEPLKETELRLSSSFKTNDGSNRSFDLELVVPIIDVNLSSDNPILQRSESLRGYAYLVDQIRRRMSEGLSRDKAIKEAIGHCIKVDILSDFLKAHYEEVAKMLNWEYDQEAEFKAIREDAREDGYEEGHAEGHAEGIEQGILQVAKNMLIRNMPIEIIAATTGLSEADISKLKSNE